MLIQDFIIINILLLHLFIVFSSIKKLEAKHNYYIVSYLLDFVLLILRSRFYSETNFF